MRETESVTAATLLGALLLVVPAPTGATVTDSADAAFEAGDYSHALELYESVLATDPEARRALFRSALLKSWENRLEESLQLYDRLLELDPSDRDVAAERAKVLSWNGRLEEAAAAFRTILDDEPSAAEVRLAYGRCLAWDEDYAAARAEFNFILADAPEHVNALVGKAQTFAWAGRLREAKTWYFHALSIDPENKDAALGLASVDLWSGNPGAAGVRAADLAQRFPDDEKIAALRMRTREALAPWVLSSVERTADTDRNRLEVIGISAGWGLRAGPSLSLGLKRFEMQDPARSASIDSLFATVGFRFGEAQRLILRGGADRTTNTVDDASTQFLGSAHYTLGLDRRWQLGGVVGRDALRYSPALADASIEIEEFSGYFALRAGTRWRIHGTVGGAALSDGNDRRNALTGFSYHWKLAALRLESGLLVRAMDFADDRNNAYFDPANFRAYLAQVRGNGQWGENKYTYSFSVDAGLQSFELNGNTVSDDQVLVLASSLGIPLPRGLVLELHVGWGDYAAQNVAGFESSHAGLRLRWRGGS